jgi:hypothetical protein
VRRALKKRYGRAGVKILDMYKRAKVYIDGKLQMEATMTPSYGPSSAAREVASIVPIGGRIKVKQGRYAWAFIRTREGVKEIS